MNRSQSEIFFLLGERSRSLVGRRLERVTALVPLLLTGARLHPPGRTDKKLCRCFDAPARRVFPDHLITVCSCVYGGGPLTSGGKCGTTALSPIIDLYVPMAVVYPRGQCASQVLLPVKIGCGLVEAVALNPGSKGATMLAVWHAVGCKPEGLPEVAPVEAVGSGACLSSLPCSHRPMRDIHEVI